MRYGLMVLALLVAAPAFATPYPDSAHAAYLSLCSRPINDAQAKAKMDAACECFWKGYVKSIPDYAEFYSLAQNMSRMQADSRVKTVMNTCQKQSQSAIAAIPVGTPYPQSTRVDFVQSCMSKSLDPKVQQQLQPMCTCTIDRTAQHISLEEFNKLAIAGTISKDARFTKAIQECNAASPVVAAPAAAPAAAAPATVPALPH